MSDHDFEKQVQQKLGELKLRPSDAVWMEVEKNIRDKKRRRRFLWLWSAALLVALTTSGVVLYHYTTRTTAKTLEMATATPASSTPSSNQTTNTELTNSTNTNTDTQASPVQPNAASTPVGNRESAIGNEPDSGTASTDATVSTNNSNQPGTIEPASAKASAGKPAMAASNTAGKPAMAVASNTAGKPAIRNKEGDASFNPLIVKNNSKETTKNNNKKCVKKIDRKEPDMFREYGGVVTTDETGVTKVG
jgi:cytoskeletal protein RodZ